MEITAIIFVLALIRGVAAALNRKPAITTLTGNTPQSLCATCAYAHIAHGMTDRQKLIACTFGGTARQLKFAVSSCTLYLFRGATEQTVQVVGFGGFAQEAEAASALIAAKVKQ